MMPVPVEQSPVNSQAELALLHRLCKSSSASAVLDLWASGLQQLTGCDRADIYLLDQSHSQLVRQISASPEGTRQDNSYSEPADYRHDSLLSAALLGQAPLHLNTSQAEGHFRLDFLQAGHTGLPPHTMITALPVRDAANHNQGVLVLLGGRHDDSSQQHTASLTGLCTSFWLQYCRHQQLADCVRQRTPTPAPRPVPLNHSYGLTGNSEAIRQLRRLISKTLHNQSSVLITGETGTGKELVAQAIHHHGPRRSFPFQVQNCASIPESLLESELFGYCRGAFTGADREHMGLIRSAQGGTLFLDEIGDMPLSLQAKLLRVLQEQSVRPLGDTRSYAVNVRIVAATHQNLPDMVASGRFRQDLYYRLAQFPIALPPLRERKDDIALLSQHFADEFAHHARLPAPVLSPALLERLESHHYPGNVRELKNMIERTLLMHGHEASLQPGHLPPELFEQACADQQTEVEDLGAGKLDERLNYLECRVLEQVLHKYHGNQKLAAQELGLSRGAMNYRLKKHQINARNWRI
ncbi:sigma-54 interaction domain-containing protein [Oceanimonas baumannii]|uniref:sigma-54 interaction domain-containing protein n=1 Tax=Oceanimonas baumannii TaxID=129578 RepID=UPI003A953556